MKKDDYSILEYPFAEVIQEHFDCLDLRYLHRKSVEEYELVSRENDWKTEFHERFYQIGNKFFDLYKSFIKNILIPKYDESLVYQKIPTFRIHMPNNLAVGEFHRDSDYGHGEEEINVFLPFTSAYGTNAFWSESKVGLEDYKPQEIKYGQYGIWNGNLKHGNYPNKTGVSRVSVDFRIIPKSQYRERDTATINTKLDFKIGGYFDIMEEN